MLLTTLYAQSKGINALYKSVELSAQATGEFRALLGNVRREQELQEFYRNHDPKLLGDGQSGKLTPEAVQLALTFPALLALRYTHGDRFRKISISGDLEGRFLEMDMKDFYVALSFLREEDMRREDSYVKLEQEGPNQQERLQRFDLGQMATEYATEVLVNEYPQAVVMGNPGVGKSTFANWLCHEWASGRLDLERVPVHVNLKEVVSLDGETSVLAYLASQYVTTEIGTYGEILRYLGEHFHFIFDGFDELSQADRRQFKRALRQLHEGRGSVNYTLLGRPYAFFDQHFHEAQKFRIRGFNAGSIERYLVATVGQFGDREKTVKLLQREIIGSNPILQEYAHSPLILSYIVLVYLSQPLAAALRKLKGIKSKYGLYEEVYQWMADYNLRQRDAATAAIREEDFSFARKVSFRKSFHYQATSIQGNDYLQATKLAEHGLGSLDRQSTGERWRFSFSSVAIQEYLTARSLVQTISAEQFVYLSRDTFFWNICQLLIGALTQSGKEETLDEIFDWLQLEHEEGEWEKTGRFLRNRYAFFTYSLLVEGSERRIRTWAETGGIDALFQDLVRHYFDPDWNQPLLEAATRMYQKLPPPGQQEFRQSVLKLMESVLQPDYRDRMATRKLYVVLDLAYVSEADTDHEFTKSLFLLIDQLVNAYEKFEEELEGLGDEEEEAEYETISEVENNRQEVGGAIFLLLQLAARVPKQMLHSYEKELEGLYERVELDFKEDIVYLQSRITPRADARRELEQRLQEANATLPCYTEIDSVRTIFEQKTDPEQMRPFPEELISLVHSAFRFSRTAGAWSESDRQLMVTTTQAYSARFLNPHFWEQEGERGLLSTTLLEALSDVPHEPMVLDLMYGVFLQTQLVGTDCAVDFQDKGVYWERLQSLFENLKASSSVPGTGLLAYLLHFVLPGHLAMARFRDDFRLVAERLILDNTDTLAIKEGEDIDSNVLNAVEQLLVAPTFEFDRNISLSLAMSYSENLGALRRQLVNELLERRTAIYEPRYLSFLHELLETPGHEIEVAEYLEWDGLYSHASNIPFLREALTYLVAAFSTDRSVLKQYAVFLLMAGSKFTLLVSRSEDWEIKDVLDVLRGVLASEEVLEVLMEPQQLEILTAVDLMGYPLIYAATGDDSFAVDYDYPHFRREVPAEATKLLNLLCLYMVPTATQEELSEVKIVSQGMPRGLFNDFYDYAQRFHLQKERFSESGFQKIGDG